MFVYQSSRNSSGMIVSNHVSLSWARMNDWLKLAKEEKTKLSSLVPQEYKGPVVDSYGDIYVPVAVKAWTREAWEKGQYQGYREESEDFPFFVTDIGQYLPEYKGPFIALLDLCI